MNNSEELQMLHNQLASIDRAIAQKSSILNGVIAEKQRTSAFARKKQRPRRYSVEVEFTPGILVPKVGSFIVSKGTIFRPHYIDSAVRTTMFLTPGDPPESIATITTRFGDPGLDITRNALFSFLAGIRDSGSDREWQEHAIPDSFLLSGLIAPFYMGERGVLSQGTEVFFDIIPQFSATDPDPIFLGTTTSHSVILSMTGFEEIL